MDDGLGGAISTSADERKFATKTHWQRRVYARN